MFVPLIAQTSLVQTDLERKFPETSFPTTNPVYTCPYPVATPSWFGPVVYSSAQPPIPWYGVSTGPAPAPGPGAGTAVYPSSTILPLAFALAPASVPAFAPAPAPAPLVQITDAADAAAAAAVTAASGIAHAPWPQPLPSSSSSSSTSSSSPSSPSTSSSLMALAEAALTVSTSAGSPPSNETKVLASVSASAPTSTSTTHQSSMSTAYSAYVISAFSRLDCTRSHYITCRHCSKQIDYTNYSLLNKVHGQCKGCGVTCDVATERPQHKAARDSWKWPGDTMKTVLRRLFSYSKGEENQFTESVLAYLDQLLPKNVWHSKARFFQCYGCHQTTWCHHCLLKEENCEALAPYCFIARYGLGRVPKLWMPLILCSKSCWERFQQEHSEHKLVIKYGNRLGLPAVVTSTINAFNADRLKRLPEHPLAGRQA